MSSTNLSADNKSDFPTRYFRVGVKIEEVINRPAIEASEENDHQAQEADQRVLGRFVMETLPDCEYWFTYNPKFRFPRLSRAVEKSPNSKLRTKVKKRIKAALANIGKDHGGISKAPTGEWLMVTVVEKNFFGD